MLAYKLNLCVSVRYVVIRVSKYGCSSTSNGKKSGPTLYESRKISHNLPSNKVCPCFEPLPNIPTGVFRCTAGEVLGPGADKSCMYKNPEYFSFHHMTFYDMQIALLPYRQPCTPTGRKR